MLCAAVSVSVFGSLDPEMHRIIEKQQDKNDQLQKTIKKLVSMTAFQFLAGIFSSQKTQLQK